MTAYKFSNSRVYRHRSERRRLRLRLAAVVLSVLLGLGTLAMVAGRLLTETVQTVSVPVARPFTGAAAVLGAGGAR